MKSIILSGILFALSLTTLYSQDINSTIKEESKGTNSTESPNYFISLGLNTIDNGNSELPFNTGDWSFKTPFFVRFERSLKSNFSASLSFSTNILKVKSGDKFYFGMDLSGLYYFDDYIFNNKNIETYAGLGLGRFYLENNGNSTFNASLGGRYWFSKSFAVSLQGIGKAAIGTINREVQNYYEYNLGIVWRTSLRKVAQEPKSINPQLNLLEDEKAIDRIAERIAERVADKIAEKLVKKGVETVLDATSNNKTEVISNISAKTLASRSDYSGDWYIAITEKDGAKIFDYVLHSTNFEAVEDNVMWISDDKRGIWLKCKIDVNTFDGTFSAIAVPNILDKGTVTITEGKIEKGAALSKSGRIVDKISFKAQFSYDLNYVLLFSGHKFTGRIEDEY